MSTDCRTSEKIRIEDLLDGRLERFGIQQATAAASCTQQQEAAGAYRQLERTGRLGRPPARVTTADNEAFNRRGDAANTGSMT
jgi:hypothetical protein